VIGDSFELLVLWLVVICWAHFLLQWLLLAAALVAAWAVFPLGFLWLLVRGEVSGMHLLGLVAWLALLMEFLECVLS
jgi:hypothetical protein